LGYFSDSRRDFSAKRAADSLRGFGRAERLGSVLAGLVRDLADARREIATLKGENAELRARLGHSQSRDGKALAGPEARRQRASRVRTR
jgi:hypothetical protein